MPQAAFSDCLFPDLLSHLRDLRAAPVVDIGGCQVIQALVVTMVIGVTDESAGLTFEIARQLVSFPTAPGSSWSGASVPLPGV